MVIIDLMMLIIELSSLISRDSIEYIKKLEPQAKKS